MQIEGIPKLTIRRPDTSPILPVPLAGASAPPVIPIGFNPPASLMNTSSAMHSSAMPMPNSSHPINPHHQPMASWPDRLDDVLFARTPPQFTPCSYEKGNMKRARARSRSGSVTLQLRSAADLEARGVIDAKTKKILKNRIMSGDQSLQHALQQYEAGDPSALEALVNSGALRQPSTSVAGGEDVEEGRDSLNAGDKSANFDLDDDLDLSALNGIMCDDDDPDSFTQFTFDDDEGSGGPAATNNAYNGGGIGRPDVTDFGESGAGPKLHSAPGSAPQAGSAMVPPVLPGAYRDGQGIKQETEQHSYSAHICDEGPELSIFGSDGFHFPGLDTMRAAPPRPLSTPKKSGGIKVKREPVSMPDTSATGNSDDECKDGNIGAYSPESRKARIQRFLEKRQQRVWKQNVKYSVRKDFAKARLRVKGRFIKKDEENLLRELLQMI
jgi:hypothetical protein